MPTVTGFVVGVDELAGHLSRTWSAYRLFPGELDRPAFVTAVGRVQEAARRVLVDGPVDLEIRSGRFLHDDVPLATHGEHGAFARVLYGRQVEQLRVASPPDAAEVAALLDAIADPNTPVAVGLEASGVAAFEVAEVAPSATVGSTGGRFRTIDGAERQRWEELVDVRSVRAELESAGRDDGLVDLLERLAGSDLAGVHEAVRQAAREVSTDLREGVARALLDPEGAVDYRALLTDVELATAIAEVAPDDPVASARAFVDRRERGEVLVRLVTVLGSATDADGLVDVLLQPEDQTTQSPPSEDDTHGIALDSLARSLVLQRDPDRTRSILEAWARRTRHAVEDRDAPLVARLVDAIGDVRHDPERHELVAAATELTIDVPLVRSLLPEDPRADLDEVIALVRPLGDVGVDRLFAVLALEEDRNRRARLLTVLGDLTRGNVNAIGRWIADERWYVVRNACCVLGRVATPATVPLLEHAVGHEDARVRREALRAIISALGNDALPLLRRLALDEAPIVAREAIRAIATLGTGSAVRLLAAIVRDGAGDLERRIQALDELATHPDADAPQELAELHDIAEELPWRLRRHLQSGIHGHPGVEP